MSEDMAAYRTRVEKAASWLRERTSGFQPQYGIILGTGLGGVAKEIRDATRFPYQEIPGFPVSTSPGHSGTLHWGWLGEVPVLAFEGRLHVYEGYSPLDITLSVRVLARLGATDMVITNACGGMNRDYQKGDLLIIDDHINLLGINPLTGSNIDEWGPRFPDMSAPYHRDHIRKLEEIAQEEQIRAHTGVYVAVAGPNLETRAEYRMLSRIGADVVGMSTIPEVIVAAQEGVRVAGISVITDLCFPEELAPVSVEEILAVARQAEPNLTKMVLRLITG